MHIEAGPVAGRLEHGSGEAPAVLEQLEDWAVITGGSMGCMSRERLDSRGIRTVMTRAVTVDAAAGKRLGLSAR